MPDPLQYLLLLNLTFSTQLESSYSIKRHWTTASKRRTNRQKAGFLPFGRFFSAFKLFNVKSSSEINQRQMNWHLENAAELSRLLNHTQRVPKVCSWCRIRWTVYGLRSFYYRTSKRKISGRSHDSNPAWIKLLDLSPKSLRLRLFASQKDPTKRTQLTSSLDFIQP